MSNKVFANGMEVSCKAAAGKSICAFPDVCFTPPLTPATPPGVPIPYPNTGMSSDTSGGTKTVQISGKEVMIKDSSSFKQSTGDEAGSAPKKNVITSKIKGKCYFTAWSMDVKLEGENAVRHLDLMTHNHASKPGGTVPWPYTDTQSMLTIDNKCTGDQAKQKAACEDQNKKDDPHCPGVLAMPTEEFKKQCRRSPSKRTGEAAKLNLPSLAKGSSRSSMQAPAATAVADSDPCVVASRCHLKPYKEKKGQKECCPGQTPHHIPPKSCLLRAGLKKYDDDDALCVCFEGTSQHYGSHGKNHAAIDHLCQQKGINNGDMVTIDQYNQICAAAVAAQCGCNAECIKQQLDESLKPTNRKIEHVHSTSGEPLNQKMKDDMNTHYDALTPPSISV